MYLFLHIWISVTFKVFSIWFNTPTETCISTAQNSFWIRQLWCLLVLLLFFVSRLPHWPNVSLWGILSFWETKKIHLGQYRVNREGGAWVSWHFWSKNCWTLSAVWVGALGKSPVIKWAHWLKKSSKNFTEAEHSLSKYCQLVRWHLMGS